MGGRLEMRVAALYDIHGNLPALEAVLSEVDADLIVVGGDFVSGPWPSETLERLRALGDHARFIRGNADRELVKAPKPEAEGGPPPEVMEWTRARLSKEQMSFLADLPLTETIEVEGLGSVLFCHATPRDDNEILTRISPDERWRAAVRDVAAGVVVCGHTHIQFDRRVDGIRLANAGSVGMPYEREPGAYWALLGPDLELRRTRYESADVESTGYPEEWPTATPEEATEFFERLSLERF
jgi:putative phosphoesterase